MGVVTRTQSMHLAKLKIYELLNKHPLLPTRQLRLDNIVQLFDFLSSLEASVFVCHHSAFGQAVAKKIFELTSEGLCPKVAAHYFREIFEKRTSQLKYPMPSKRLNNGQKGCYVIMCTHLDDV